MGDDYRGSKVLKRILNTRKAENKAEYRIDLVSAINSFDNMFMPKQDKDTLLIVLKSLLKGKVVSVKKKKAKQVMTGAEMGEYKSQWSETDKLNLD
jgi:hypothetical protein